MTQERVKEIFNYEDGQLYFKLALSNRVKIGDKAGCKQINGKYIGTGVEGERLLNHRLIWIYFNGPIPTNKVIDHIDRDGTNNRIENLRLVTPQENTWNTGAKGWVLARNKYIARITYNHKVYTIKTCMTKEEAARLYQEVKAIIHTYEGILLEDSRIREIVKTFNTKMQGNNTSGSTGVNKRKNRYQATIQYEGKNRSIGTFSTLLEAQVHRDFVMSQPNKYLYIKGALS